MTRMSGKYQVRFCIISGIIMMIACCAGTRDPGHGEAAEAYGSRALVQFNAGNFSSALALYTTALTRAQNADLPDKEAVYVFNIGRILFEMGDPDSARMLFETAYQRFRRSGDEASTSRTAAFIALAFAQEGNSTEAWKWYNSNPLSGTGDERIFGAMVKALLMLEDRRIDDAALCLDSIEGIYAKKKAWYSLANVKFYKARIQSVRGKHDAALKELGSALDLMDKAPERYRRWRVLLACATESFCLGDETGALRYYERASQCAPRGIHLPALDSFKNCSGIQ